MFEQLVILLVNDLWMFSMVWMSAILHGFHRGLLYSTLLLIILWYNVFMFISLRSLKTLRTQADIFRALSAIVFICGVQERSSDMWTPKSLTMGCGLMLTPSHDVYSEYWHSETCYFHCSSLLLWPDQIVIYLHRTHCLSYALFLCPHKAGLMWSLVCTHEDHFNVDKKIVDTVSKIERQELKKHPVCRILKYCLYNFQFWW